MGQGTKACIVHNVLSCQVLLYAINAESTELSPPPNIIKIRMMNDLLLSNIRFFSPPRYVYGRAGSTYPPVICKCFLLVSDHLAEHVV